MIRDASESKKSEQNLFDIPMEFKIESLRQEIKLKVKDESLEKLSLSKIIMTAKKIKSYELLRKIADYYVENNWLFVAGNVYELIGTPESLEKAETCYVKGRHFLSAINVCRTIGTPDALTRAYNYSCRTC